MTNVKCQIVYGGPAEPPEQLLIISDVGLCKSFACSHSDLQRDPEFLDYRISEEFPYALIIRRRVHCRWLFPAADASADAWSWQGHRRMSYHESLYFPPQN